MNLEQALNKVKQNGRPHEWLWRLIVDHGYKFTEIEPHIRNAYKYWDRHVNKSSKKYHG